MPRNISSTPKRRGRPRKDALQTDNLNGGVVPQGDDTREEGKILTEVKDRFEALREFAHGVSKQQVQSLIVSGAPGIGKTFTLDQVISHYKEQGKVKKFTVVKGFMTAAMLYRLLYDNREKGNVVFLDDCDAIFWNEDALNILKAALDTVEHRIVSYRAMGDDDVPTEFEFKAAMVFATNIDFHHYIKVAKNRIVEHLKALLSRCQYLPMKLHHPRSVVIWVRHMIRDLKILTGHPHGLTLAQSEEILDYLLKNHDRIPYLSLRTAVKAVELVKLNPTGWKRLADFTLLKQD